MVAPTAGHETSVPLGLRVVAARYAHEAGETQRHVHRLGRRHRTAHFGVRILAAIAGVVAGTAGIVEGAPIVAGVAGFSATALVGLNPVLDAETLARFHFAQAAGYGAISRLFTSLAEGPEEPTRTELDELIERLGRWEARSLQDQTAGVP